MAERTQQLTELRPLTPEDTEVLARFLRALPERDLTFLKEEIDDDTVDRWCRDDQTPRWMLVADDEPVGLLSVSRGALWSAHVGELRLVVAEAHRGRGLGRRLARHGLAEALRLGLAKIVVEVVADKEGDIAMFTSIGFAPEALLKDHIRDRDGNVHDLVVLAHEVDARAGSIDAIGVANDVAAAAGA